MKIIIATDSSSVSMQFAMAQTGPLLADAAERTMRPVMAGRTLCRVRIAISRNLS